MHFYIHDRERENVATLESAQPESAINRYEVKQQVEVNSDDDVVVIPLLVTDTGDPLIYHNRDLQSERMA